MVYLAPPNAKDMIENLEIAIKQAKNIPAHDFHQKIKNIYSWKDVANQTEKVYEQIMSKPNPSMK